MSPWGRLWRSALAALGILVVVVGAALLVLTQTEWGREQVKQLALDQLSGSVNGRIRIDELDGNLLTGATLREVVITDTAGRPFFRAERVSLDYWIPDLLTQKIHLGDVRLIRPVVVLNKLPGGEWNFSRIFPGDTAAPDTTQRARTVRITDLIVQNGLLLVRSPWEPDSALAGAARDSAVRAALSAETRERVVRAPGGYQQVMLFRDIDGRFPLLRLSDPDSSAIVVEVATLNMLALPYQPPAAHLRDLAGRFVFGDSLIHLQDVRVVLPNSRIAAEGVYALEDSLRTRIQARAAPIAFADLQWLYPQLPEEGGGELGLLLERGMERTHLVVRDLHLEHEDAVLTGRAEVTFGDTLRLGETELRFAGIDTRLIERFAPDLEIPRHGELRGHVVLAGTPAALEVDGLVTFAGPSGISRLVADGRIGTTDGFVARDLRLRVDPLQVGLVSAFRPELPVGGTITGHALLNGTLEDLRLAAELVHHGPRTGRSELLAQGEIGFGEAFHAQDLDLHFQPLQVALARAFAPDLPLGGTLTGRATLSGSTATRFAVQGNVVHHGLQGRSHLVGNGQLAMDGSRWFEADLRALPLSLNTLGRFVPSAGLHGVARGELHLRGTPADLVLALDMRIPEGGGRVDARGRFDLESARERYAMRARLVSFNAHAVSTRAPQTALTGTISVQGRGLDPATMNAVLAADLSGVRVDTLGVDSVEILAAVTDGLLRIEEAAVNLQSARAQLEGSFGLVAGRSGELYYRVRVDSLSQFAGYLPVDTTSVPPPEPRPALQAEAIEIARADSARIARETEVERAATGYPPEPTLAVDTVRAIPRDSVAGSIRAEGVLAGNLERFDLRGEARLQEVVFGGNAVQNGWVEYAYLNAGTPRTLVALETALDSVRAAGFALDSVRATIDYRDRTSEGTARIAIYQDDQRDYRLAADYQLAPERNVLRLDDLALRFDTTLWALTQPGAIRWGEDGIEIETIELVSDEGGRIYADGELPSEGSVSLVLDVERLQIANVMGLLQDTVSATGLLSLHTEVAGTQASPRFEGSARLRSASYGGTELPDVRTVFEYASTQLEAEAVFLRDTMQLAVVVAELPINLALAGDTEPRLPDRPLLVELRADSLPLDPLPHLTDAVADVRGRLRGHVVVRGTYEDPDASGILDLDLARLKIVSTGVTLREVAGLLRLRDESVVIDSLVAHSGNGVIRMTGAVGISPLTEPSFALELNANDALVLDNELGRLWADAALAISGPLEAVHITGDVEIDRGVVSMPETTQVLDLSDPAYARALDSLNVAPEVLPEPNPLLDNLRVDVNVAIDRSTWIRSDQMNVEIYTPADAGPLVVHMDRGEDALTVRGTVATDRGEYVFAGKFFEVVGGSIVFLGATEVDPLLQITAQNMVNVPGRSPLGIRVIIGGTLSEPTFALDSDAQPPLSESDLLSYLAFGRSSSTLLQQGAGSLSGGRGSGNLVGNLRALATEQLATTALGAVVGDLERDTRRTLGLDVLRITPAELPPDLALDGYVNVLRATEVEIGKYLSDRWFVTSQVRPTLVSPGARIEYQTAQGFRWRVTFEPRFLPRQPTFGTGVDPSATGILGTFLFFERRF